MKRALAIGFGLLEVVAPTRIIEQGERLAFENPETGRLRSWTVPMARLEGLVFCWLVVRDGGSPTDLRLPLGAFGFAMALLPRSVLEFALGLAYENPNELEVKVWVVPVTRLLGVCYLALGLFAGRADAPSDE